MAEAEELDHWVYGVAAEPVESRPTEEKVVADRILDHMLDEMPLVAELEEGQYKPELDAVAIVDCRPPRPNRLAGYETHQDFGQVHHTSWVTVEREQSLSLGRWSVSQRMVVQAEESVMYLRLTSQTYLERSSKLLSSDEWMLGSLLRRPPLNRVQVE